jgi:hypothetical protein
MNSSSAPACAIDLCLFFTPASTTLQGDTRRGLHAGHVGASDAKREHTFVVAIASSIDSGIGPYTTVNSSVGSSTPRFSISATFCRWLVRARGFSFCEVMS